MPTELALLQRSVLDHKDGEHTEIRIPQKGVQEFVTNGEAYKTSIEKYLGSDCYVGINPRIKPEGNKDAVAYFTCLVFDIDPIRGRGEPSTDAQHTQACAVGQRVAGDFPSSFVVSSGSGCHVYVPLERTENRVGAEQDETIRAWSNGVRIKYKTPGVKFDSVFDAPRIIRVWGSHNDKSNRPCVPIVSPSEIRRVKAPWLGFSVPKVLAQITGEGYEKRFQRLLQTNVPLAKLMRSDARYDSRSEADFAFVALLVKAHFTVPEIKLLAPLNPLGRGSDMEKGDVERIIEKVKFNGTETTSLTHDSGSYFRGLATRRVGIKTGFKTLDEMISGLKEQKVYIMAARPTDGKTTLITQMLCNIAEAGNVCLFFPTEVGAEPIYDKIVCRKSGISLRKFQNGDFTSSELSTIKDLSDSISRIPLVIHEDFGLTTTTIEQRIKEIQPDVVAIDYIQAMAFKEQGSSSEIGTAMRHIKELAGDYRIPIILASQLRRGDGTMDLGQLKGSGSLEELADVVSFLYTKEKLQYPRQVELMVMKSKYSETGPIPMKFFSSTAKFEEVGDAF